MRTLNEERLYEIERYVIEYQKENGKAPTYRQIMHKMSMSSLNLVQRYVLALERQGRISRTKLGNIDVPPQLKPSGSAMVSLVGDIACGNPTDAIQNIEESYALPRSLFGDGDLFMLRARGDSMIDVGIQKGDLVVIRQQSTVEDGEIAAVLIQDESTLKRVYHDGNQLVLHPENKTMEDIDNSLCDATIQLDKRNKMKGVILCLYTGLRIGELLALEWEDIDLNRGEITVNKTCHDGKNEKGEYCRLVDTPKTATSHRVVPLPKQLIPFLKEWKKARQTTYVVEAHGRAISVRSYQSSFSIMLKNNKIPHRGFHALRHTFATRALECGMDVKSLSEILGHKSPTVTLKRYAHSMMDHKKMLMNRLGKLF